MLQLPGYANFRGLGNILEYYRTETGVTLYCEDSLRIDINIYDDGIFRYSLYLPNQTFTLPADSLASDRWPFPEFSMLDEDAFITLGTREINIIIHKMPCRITVVDKKGMVINKDDPELGLEWQGTAVRLWKSMAPDERFYGLGVGYPCLNLRGTETHLHHTRSLDAVNNEKSVPFYLGLVRETAYGIYLNNSSHSTFNFEGDTLHCTSIMVENGKLDYFFIYGPRVDVVLNRHGNLAERITSPPGWALGYQYQDPEKMVEDGLTDLLVGMQRYTAVLGEDSTSEFEALKSSILNLQAMNLSGGLLSGVDLGSASDTLSAEAYIRWAQAAVCSPLFTKPQPLNKLNNLFPSFDSTAQVIIHNAIRLRQRLMPYFYSTIWEAHESGVPIVRPMFFHFQEDSAVFNPRWQYQFMVGENLIVAPIVNSSDLPHFVYLPRGAWIDYRSGEIHEGPQELDVNSGLDFLPIFVRQGSMIAVRDSAADNPDLTLEIFPGEVYSGLLLYEDNQKTYSYMHGEYRVTQFELFPESGQLSLIKTRIEDNLVAEERSIEYLFRNWPLAPHRIRLNKVNLPEITRQDSNIGYYYDENRRLLLIRVRDTLEEQTVEIE